MTEQISDLSGLDRDYQTNWPWTRRQLLGLAPDVVTVKATTRLIDPVKWEQLGQSETFIWGYYKRSNLSPHKIFVRLADLTGECSCIATKHPCKFLIALLVLFSKEKPLFVHAETPKWVNEVISARVDEHSKNALKQISLNKVKASMAEFGRWLRDQVRQGVANFAERKSADLESMANRLIDAHMLQMANDLRELGKLVAPPKGNPPDDWPEILVKGLGRFYLLVQAWERFDQLSPAEQNDLIHATVFVSSRLHLDSPNFQAAETISDQWIVFGRRSDALGRRWVRRTWLYGLESKRFALLEGEVSGRKVLLANQATGDVYQADFQFEAGTTRFSGQLVNAENGRNVAHLTPKRLIDSRPQPNSSPPTDFSKIEQKFVQALTQNPWLRIWPVYLNAVRLNYDKHTSQWLISDQQGRSIPVLNGKESGWHLMAGSQGQPIDLFGEWSNDGLHLVSVYYDDAWLDLTVWGSRS
ncbi:MAG: hypothetical protein AB8G95_19515 [Anaerolineae bacterium]